MSEFHCELPRNCAGMEPGIGGGHYQCHWCKTIERLRTEVSRLRVALREEFRDGFNDLGPTRQARWDSADAYADALMADFDSVSGRREP